GFQMINQSFRQILSDEGVKKIEALGKKFNPNFHHAVELDYQEDKEEDIILAEMQSGYVYKDRLLRPSLVTVNKKQEKENENE
ncbi:MAG: nucleotide exchange factor GrpE, partial [Bacilli bacterium]